MHGGFGGDGPCRRAIGGGTSSAMHRHYDAICRGLVNCSLVNPQSVSDSDFEDEGGGGGAATPRTVKLKPRDATVFEVDEPPFCINYASVSPARTCEKQRG